MLLADGLLRVRKTRSAYPERFAMDATAIGAGTNPFAVVLMKMSEAAAIGDEQQAIIKNELLPFTDKPYLPDGATTARQLVERLLLVADRWLRWDSEIASVTVPSEMEEVMAKIRGTGNMMVSRLEKTAWLLRQEGEGRDFSKEEVRAILPPLTVWEGVPSAVKNAAQKLSAPFGAMGVLVVFLLIVVLLRHC
jgi:hypothetical protein